MRSRLCREGYLDAVSGAAWRRDSRGLAEFELVRGFAGPYDVTPDWNPPSAPARGSRVCTWPSAGAATASSSSPAVGEVVAAEVTGRTPPIDVSELRPQRFAEGRLLQLAYGPGARA